MNCTTVRTGKPCPFMSAEGCSYNGGICLEVVDNCNGCNRSIEFESGWYCSAFPEPATKWKNGDCNLASHTTDKTVKATGKINPLKASKRGAR